MFEWIAIYFLIGTLAGTLSGLLGIGSGVVVVPALVMVFTQRHFDPSTIMHVAAGTSLATMILTTGRSLLGHLRHKVAFWPVYRLIFPGVVIGTVLGAIFAHSLPSYTLKIIFAVVVFSLGLKMFFHFKNKKGGHLPNVWVCSSLGLFIGGKSGLLGLGGGSVSIPLLTHFGVSMRQAVVVSCAIGITVSTVGAVSFIITGLHATGLPAYSTGYVYWPAWLGIVVGSQVFVPLGVTLSHHLRTAVLRRVFAVFLLFVGLHMMYTVI